ncbi:MAG: hypothetical protein MHPSP_003371, partial [Paramarteilia canceri]
CSECLPTFRKVPKSNYDFECEECQAGLISLPDDMGQIHRVCRKITCSDDEYYSYEKEECIKCSNSIENSNGRYPNTLPLIQYCSCPENTLKIAHFDTIKCYAANQLNTFIMNHIKESFNKNKYEVEIKMDDGSGNFVTNFKIIHCHPTIRYFSNEVNCLCGEKYQFFDGYCKPCLISSILDNFHEKTCNTCSENETISSDRSECFCDEGFERKGERCVQKQCCSHKNDEEDTKYEMVSKIHSLKENEYYLMKDISKY